MGTEPKTRKQLTAEAGQAETARQSHSARDRYGRILGTVTVDPVIVNHELLKAGLAWQFTKYDKSKELTDLEAAARKAKVGLWSDAAPVAPWDWRAAETERKKDNPKRPSKAGSARRD